MTLTDTFDDVVIFDIHIRKLRNTHNDFDAHFSCV